jgi:hypothetical protein
MAFAVLDAFIVFTKRVALDRTKNKSEIRILEIDASVGTILDKSPYLIRLIELSNGKPNWQRSEAT